MSAVLSDRWPKLSKPIFAADNVRIAHALSAAAMNNPVVKPTGRPYFRAELAASVAITPCRPVRNQPQDRAVSNSEVSK